MSLPHEFFTLETLVSLAFLRVSLRLSHTLSLLDNRYKMKTFLPVGKAAWERMDPEERTPWENSYLQLCQEHNVTPNLDASKKKRKKRGRPPVQNQSNKRAATTETKTLEVEQILGQRVTSNGVTQYLVHWAGYDAATAATWEPEENLIGCSERLEAFKQRLEKEKAPEPAPPAPVVVKQETDLIEYEEVYYVVAMRGGQEILLLEREAQEEEERRRVKATEGSETKPQDSDGAMAEDSGEVEVMGTQGALPLVDLPHPRELCRHPQTKSKIDFCSKCCCFVCETLVKDCEAWETHCHADSSLPYWKELRRQKKKEAAPTVQLKRGVSDFFETSAAGTVSTVTAGRVQKAPAPITIVEEIVLAPLEMRTQPLEPSAAVEAPSTSGLENLLLLYEPPSAASLRCAV